MRKSQDFHPTLLECDQAHEAFFKAIQHYAMSCSQELAIRCALDAVWEAGRRYQAQLEASERALQIQEVTV